MMKPGIVAHEGLRPVLWCDFNEMQDDGTIVARSGDWLLPSGQAVILDDREGTRCPAKAIGRPTWDKQDKYVITLAGAPVEHYEAGDA